MYRISIKATGNTAPWEIPLSTRCEMLRQSLKEGKSMVLLLYDRADTSTFRYRGYNITQITAKSNRWRSIYFFSYEIDKIIEYIDKISLVVLIRMKWTRELDRFIYLIKANNIPVLFEVDDLVFDTNYLSVVTNTLNVPLRNEVEYDFWFAYIGRIGYTASKADGFITTNAYLGELIKKKFNKTYAVIPNFLNYEQLEVSEKCLMMKKLQKARKPFIIGYFSGTPSHVNDFKTVYRELIMLMEEYSDINLKVVGFMEFPDEMKPYIKSGRVTFLPLVNFLELQRIIAEVDVNIVPLVENEFTNCKSELKFFEAAIVNSPTFAQPIFTYSQCIEDGVNGFLCRQGDWYSKIKDFYLGKFDTGSIIKNAYNYALENYQGDNILKKIEECYDMFTA